MQKLSRTLGTPLHHQISAVIKDGIATGRYQPGQRLPTEDALCRLFSVSRITVRRAMQGLEEQGLIDRRQGDGTFVAQSASVVSLQTPLAGYMKQVAESRALSQPRLESFEEAEPPPYVRSALSLAAGERVMKLVRLRVRGNLPILHSTAWLPLDVGTRFEPADISRYALSELMARAGFPYSRIEATAAASLADPLIARSLQVPIGAALVDVHRVAFDKHERPVEYQNVLGPPDRYQMRVTIAG
ncbi:MAG: GntR family transcriptional regulator [Pigmentiphaga sp.]|uniref:GntR family transcriptional regulator n=1 Tax=Pigmentiphaga sp. TaxID=1977564 RepID=UPI0029B0D4A9|nr:GntR family transcriptional regulator [Pigmentiphaga sp.]MDX3906395.1 GntR family transcriptional regulator [Pigmentiphaga sp.]